jgi:S-adenosylmethionine hydrolase
MKLITFSSDFGLDDAYVGSVQGILLRIYPDVRIVNVTHSIDPFRIEKAAYILSSFYANFPKGTVHLMVVDPGVGGERRPLILRTANYLFVGPDNGIFTYVISKEAYTAYMIDSGKMKQFYPISAVSPTFHARDLFAPAAALLAKGVKAEHLGSTCTDELTILSEGILIENDVITARIIDVDRFGNITSNFSQFDLERLTGYRINKVSFKGIHFDTMSKTYSDVKKGEPLVLWGSSGYLEIALNQGSAAQEFNCKPKVDAIIIALKINKQ